MFLGEAGIQQVAIALGGPAAEIQVDGPLLGVVAVLLALAIGVAA